jgi:hypothetical protein
MRTDQNPRARSTDPETSWEAARLLQADKQALQMLEFLALNDRTQGWTNHEIQLATVGLGGLCPWHRLTDLRQAGLAQWLLDTEGHPVRRPGPTPRTQRATVISVKGGQLIRLLRHYKEENNG